MALPTELDFAKKTAATPARMNEAMEYIVSRFRALESIQPEFQSVINQLRGVGLERLAEALIPIFENAEAIEADLEAIQATYAADTFKADQIAALLTTLRAGVAAEFDTLAKMAAKIVDYRSKYLGAYAAAPEDDDNGDPVVAGASYFDTSLNRTRVYSGSNWIDAGSAVDGILENQDFTATGGETIVPVDGGYDPGNIIVSVNGLRLAQDEVDSTSGTSLTLTSALSASDVVSWTKFGAVTVANVFTKTESLATFMGITAAYTKAAADDLLALKADKTTTYTKSEVDSGLGARATLSDTIVTKTASYTLQAGDNGKTLYFNSATAVTLTVPNDLPVGFNVFGRQVGAGRVTIAPAAGATRRSLGSTIRTAGQYAGFSVVVSGNAGGASAIFELDGALTT